MEGQDRPVHLAANGEVQHRLRQELFLQPRIEDDRVPQRAETVIRQAGATMDSLGEGRTPVLPFPICLSFPICGVGRKPECVDVLNAVRAAVGQPGCGLGALPWLSFPAIRPSLLWTRSSVP